MARFRWSETIQVGDEEFPLQSAAIEVDLVLDLGGIDVPEAARRHIALRTLKRFCESVAEDALQEEEAAKATITISETSDDKWVQPAGLDLRVVKSAHRVIEEVARRGESGRAVKASDLVREGLVSAPTMARLLRSDEVAGTYIAPYIQVSPAGRSKAIDLTPKGRVLASRIRAGVVPA